MSHSTKYLNPVQPILPSAFGCADRYRQNLRSATAARFENRSPVLSCLDEVVLKIADVKHWLWRAVDQTGIVLDVLVPNADATSKPPSGGCASC